jgi:hypothetical protein
MSIPHFVPLEMVDPVQASSGFGFVTAVGQWSMVAIVGVESVIDVAVETGRTVKPRASADENATRKPFRAVIAIRCAVVRRDIIVAVRAYRRYSDLDAYLGLGLGRRGHEAHCCESRHRKEL